MRKVILIQGGGVGLDQADALRAILTAAGVAIEFEVHAAGRAALEAGAAEAIPQASLDAVKACGVALKTKLLQPKGAGMPTAHGPSVPTVVAAATRSLPCASFDACGLSCDFSMSLTVIRPTQ